jgi:beta-barrel assembly-enhancing protease
MIRRRQLSMGPRAGRGGCGLRFVLALVIVAFALISYFGSTQYNPVTGEDQHISLSARQEIALGLQAAPQMLAQYGGLYPDQRRQDLVDEVGFRIVENSDVAGTDWQFEFNLLSDPQTVNAFALPGGQVFITQALLQTFTTEGQMAGVLAHEIGHVIARHGAQHMAKSELTQGLVGAVLVASENASAAQVAAIIGGMVNMKYGRDDELQSDELGVRFMSQAGYDPRAMVEVMQILDQASSGARPPEFFSTHPNPDNRIQRIQEAIQRQFPNGVPDGLTP